MNGDGKSVPGKPHIYYSPLVKRWRVRYLRFCTYDLGDAAWAFMYWKNTGKRSRLETK